jgi:hypothetical protein
MIVEVKLFNETLGTVEWNDNKGCSTFQYSSKALNRSIEPSPIIMPTQERIFETNRDHINFHFKSSANHEQMLVAHLGLLISV